MGKHDGMLANSSERPGWLFNDLCAFEHRYITSREGKRIRLKGYFKRTQGIDCGRIACDEVSNA